MLNGIHLVDFGNHRDTRLTFGRITALVGQNGAGKTNVMRAVMELSRLCNDEEEVNRIVFDNDRSLTRKNMARHCLAASWPSIVEQETSDWGVIIDTSSSRIVWLWRINLPQENTKWLPDPKEDTTDIPVGIHKEFELDIYGRSPAGSKFIIASNVPAGEVIKSEIAPYIKWESKYFKTAGGYLQQPSYSESVPPVLSENCHELASVVSYLKGDKDELFASIIDSLREVVPVLRRVRNRPTYVERMERRSIVLNRKEHFYDEEKQVLAHELRFDMASGNDLPASAISEGTLVTLAILTAVMQDGDSRPQTILLDDIESGLHPKAQRDLVKQLKRLQETRPELQIIFSSHSPYIIDEMVPEDVWLFAADKEGCAHAAKLSDHPDAKRALEVLTTGEFWSAEGEDWVLDPTKRRQPEAVQSESTQPEDENPTAANP